MHMATSMTMTSMTMIITLTRMINPTGLFRFWCHHEVWSIILKFISNFSNVRFYHLFGESLEINMDQFWLDVNHDRMNELLMYKQVLSDDQGICFFSFSFSFYSFYLILLIIFYSTHVGTHGAISVLVRFRLVLLSMWRHRMNELRGRSYRSLTSIAITVEVDVISFYKFTLYLKLLLHFSYFFDLNLRIFCMSVAMTTVIISMERILTSSHFVLSLWIILAIVDAILIGNRGAGSGS